MNDKVMGNEEWDRYLPEPDKVPEVPESDAEYLDIWLHPTEWMADPPDFQKVKLAKLGQQNAVTLRALIILLDRLAAKLNRESEDWIAPQLACLVEGGDLRQLAPGDLRPVPYDHCKVWTALLFLYPIAADVQLSAALTVAQNQGYLWPILGKTLSYVDRVVCRWELEQELRRLAGRWIVVCEEIMHEARSIARHPSVE